MKWKNVKMLKSATLLVLTEVLTLSLQPTTVNINQALLVVKPLNRNVLIILNFAKNYRRRIKAIGSRENRWMQDVNHQVSKALVESNPKYTLFVLEDLSGVRSVTERVRTKDRYVSVSWSFYDLEQKLIYKAKQNRSLVLKVDPRYTSQCCPVCGHIEKANRNKKIHLFACKNCGYKSNDDRIGAMNLYRMGINYLTDSQVPSIVTAE